MGDKAKRVIYTILAQSLGVACDAALIYNFIHREQSNAAGWNLYCQRYISMFTVVSWFMLVCAVVMTIHLEIAVKSDDYRKKHAESLKKTAGDFKPKLWKTLWRWTESVPMIIFTAIFAGNFHLATLWLLLTIFGITTEKSATKLEEIFKKAAIPQTFSGVMEELNKKASLN